MLEGFEANKKKQNKLALACTKEVFANDVTNRLAPLLKKGSPDALYNALLDSWDLLMEASHVALFDDFSISEFIITRGNIITSNSHKLYKKMIDGLDVCPIELKDSADKLVENLSLMNEVTQILNKNKLHRFVIEPILETQFNKFKFKRSKQESKWTGAEISNACVGGFGERTTHKSLKYDDLEQGRDEKVVIITALAVYFIELIRTKQTQDFLNAVDKYLGKEDTVSTTEIKNIIQEIEKNTYQ